jgi:hypothetical protein
MFADKSKSQGIVAYGVFGPELFWPMKKKVFCEISASSNSSISFTGEVSAKLWQHSMKARVTANI